MKNTPQSYLHNNAIAQRESLLEQNQDLLYGVYEVVPQNDDEIELLLTPNVLACYKNKFDDGIQGLDTATDITLLDIKSLMNRKVESLSGPEFSPTRRIVLLSNGVIEYISVNDKDGKQRKHLITTLRDGGAAASLKRTTTAGRNTGWNLQEEALREHIEEAPFLGKNREGNYMLCTTSTKPEHIDILTKSIQYFLANKYTLMDDNADNKKMIKTFERSFAGVKYSDLGDILKDIVAHNRFSAYTSQVGDMVELKDDMKQLKVSSVSGDTTSGKFFVFFDEKNNTLEYRSIQYIVSFPSEFTPLSKKPGMLLLESQNQYPRLPRIENAGKGAVPTVEYISNKVREKMMVGTILDIQKQFKDKVHELYILHKTELDTLYGIDVDFMFPEILQGFSGSMLDELDQYFMLDSRVLSGSDIFEPIHMVQSRINPMPSYFEEEYHRVEFSSDSSVFGLGDTVWKVYFRHGKELLEKYHQFQNKAAEKTYALDISGHLKGEKFDSMHFEILNLPEEVYGNEDSSLVIVKKIPSKYTTKHIQCDNDKYNYDTHGSFCEQVTSLIDSDIGFYLRDIAPMNFQIIGVENGVLKIVITDILNFISDINDKRRYIK